MPEPRIWILPPEVAERIAAGEVVERPASVVKELVENALDAGARRVSVEIEAGGKALIRVSDDGLGMTTEEARLALERHATSKLRSAEDLFAIRTLGFRGEALPSIAAVSDMEIVTRPRDAAEGTRLVVRAGALAAQETAAAQPGTQVTVRRLFFNVPVREKFLRSDAAEAGFVTDWLQRLALSRPDVSFRLVHDGREVLLSPGSVDPLNVVVAVLGRAVGREMLCVDAPAEAVAVAGYVGRPTLTRGSRALQHTYVNGRAVRSALFYRALDEAFRSTMPAGRYPVAVLFVSVAPGEVDVNVHPAKTEVRFRDEPAVFAAVLNGVRRALAADAAGEASVGIGEPPSTQVAPLEESALPFAAAAMGAPAVVPGAPRREAAPRGRLARREEGGAGGWAAPEASVAPRAGAPRSGARDAAAGEPRVQATSDATAAVPPLTLLGQAQDLFVLARDGDGDLWVIDQHVAHERVLFDRLMGADRVGEAPEPLLIPVTLEMDGARALALEEHAAPLGELGFVVEAFGPRRYALRAVPRSLVGLNYERVFADLADELAAQSRGGSVRLRPEEVAMAAAGRSCKAAVKAGRRLGREEMERLLADLRAARHPHTCPHGRPVFLRFSVAEVARLFGARSCEDPAV